MHKTMCFEQHVAQHCVLLLSSSIEWTRCSLMWLRVMCFWLPKGVLLQFVWTLKHDYIVDNRQMSLRWCGEGSSLKSVMRVRCVNGTIVDLSSWYSNHTDEFPLVWGLSLRQIHHQFNHEMERKMVMHCRIVDMKSECYRVCISPCSSPADHVSSIKKSNSSTTKKRRMHWMCSILYVNCLLWEAIKYCQVCSYAMCHPLKRV